MTIINLAIIDEYPAVRRALVERLKSSKRLNVVAAVSNVLEEDTFLPGKNPDVILLELKGRREAGPALVSRLRRALGNQKAGIIVLTSYADDLEQEEALKAGADRYLLKNIDTENLISEIESVANEVCLLRGTLKKVTLN
jgi:DNA-binding NarL/FixJ family response regulator